MKKLLYLFLITIIGCTPTKEKKKTLSINVSISPQKYFVEQLLGSKYQINVVVKPGYNPETYEPTPKQLQELESGTLFFQVCKNGFDQKWANDFKQINPDMKIIDCSQKLELIEDVHDHDHSSLHGVDPHIWVSPRSVLAMVETMKDVLIYNFPGEKDSIEIKYSELRKDILEMHNLFESSLMPFKSRSVLVYHPVLSYIAKDYGLVQLSLEEEGKEPTVQSLAKLVDDVKTNRINTIFVQKEFDTKKAELLANEANLYIVVINPLSEDWMKETRFLLDEIIKSFSLN